MKKLCNRYQLIILCGPTASGKTDLSHKLALQLDGEIINADVGQLYTPLSVGTAKPLWKNHPVKHHLFDILEHPHDYSVQEYRKAVQTKINDSNIRNKIPILVGGSFFYLKSLFFPPKESVENCEQEGDVEKSYSEYSPWEKLYAIDPIRAQQLHKNDLYRINRALAIWERTGIKPSLQKPDFEDFFPTLWVFIEPPKDVLQKNISKRIHDMISGKGFNKTLLEEVRVLIGTEWEEFLKTKKLIGYPEIIEWVKKGENEKELAPVIKVIEQKTWQYARRQMIFAKKLKADLEKEFLKNNLLSSIMTIEVSSFETIEAIKSSFFQKDKK